MRLARYERAGEARLARVVGKELLDIFDAAEAMGNTPKWWSDMTGLIAAGPAITANAKNLTNAVKLIEFLAGDEAQKLYAKSVYEYPIRGSLSAAPLIASWDKFKADDLDFSLLVEYNAEAVRVADRAGWP